jgi:hypothetical protein
MTRSGETLRCEESWVPYDTFLHQTVVEAENEEREREYQRKRDQYQREEELQRRKDFYVQKMWPQSFKFWRHWYPQEPITQ